MSIPNIDKAKFPEARREQTRNLLLEQIRTEKTQPARKPRKRLILGGAAGAVIATTAGAFYIASQPVADQSIIRCLYSQDLNEPSSMTFAMPQSEELANPVERCAEHWREGVILPTGINPEVREPEGDFNPDDGTTNNPVPELTACVDDGMVAVIPGPEDICADLGIPKLER